MAEQDKRCGGEQAEPGGRPKAPGRLALLQRFVNTWNQDFPEQWDRLGTPGAAEAWLREKRLISTSAHVTPCDAVRLRELREAFRAILIANHEPVPSPPPTAVATLARVSQQAELRIRLDETGQTSLEPAKAGIEAAIATLLGILHEARLSGDWPRLKGCRQCGYAFFDWSKNRSASWCTMTTCGNRAKNRAYRKRRSRTISSRQTDEQPPTCM